MHRVGSLAGLWVPAAGSGRPEDEPNPDTKPYQSELKKAQAEVIVARAQGLAA